MFETPFALREPKEPFAPKGPSVPTKINIDIDLEVAKLQLVLPKNRSASKPQPQRPIKKGGLNDNNFCNLVGNSNTWRHSLLVSREWDFYGPKFTGTYAHVNFGLGVIKPLKSKETASFFHPRAFETVIAEVLEKCYHWELDKDLKRQRYFSPMNWHPIEKYEPVAVKFDVLPNKSVGFNEPFRVFSIPISSNHLVWMAFSINRKNDSPDNIDIDDWIKLDSIYEFIDTIIDSFECELIGSSKDENHKILTEFGSKSLVENYPPLRWIDNEAEFATAIKAIPRATG